MTEQHVHFHNHGEKESFKRPKGTEQQTLNDKRKRAKENARVAFKLHAKALGKCSMSFFNELFLTLFYAFRLAGFALQDWGKRQKQKQGLQKKPKEDIFSNDRWP